MLMTKPTQFNMPRRPTKSELDELYKFELDRSIDFDPFYHRDDLQNEIRDALGNAFIAVYDNLPEGYPEKILSVAWGYGRSLSSYMLYIWENGKLQPVKQHEEFVQSYFGDE